MLNQTLWSSELGSPREKTTFPSPLPAHLEQLSLSTSPVPSAPVPAVLPALAIDDNHEYDILDKQEGGKEQLSSPRMTH
jgi:hypothetical protein